MARAPDDAIPPAGFVRLQEVDSLIATRMEAMFARIGETKAEAPGMGALVQALVASLADLTGQGVGREKKIEPHVLQARENARGRMMELIQRARDRGDVPVYELRHKVFLDDVLIEPAWTGNDHVARPTVIEWPGVPSLGMAPKNDAATGIFEAFKASIGEAIGKPDAPLWVSYGGLTIQGQGPHRREMPAPSEGREGVRLVGREQPGSGVEMRVLGKTHPPARQVST